MILARKFVLSCLLAGMLAACQNAPPAAQTASTPSGQETLEPEADAVLKDLSATLSAAQALTVRTTAMRESKLPNGQIVHLGATSDIAVRRPDHLAVAVGSDLGNFSLWYDGEKLSVLNPIDNVYTTTPQRGDVDAVVELMEQRLGLELPIRPLLLSNPYPALADPGTTGVYVGSTFVHDIPVDHFAYRSPGTDWEIWVATTGKKLLQRVVLIERDRPEQSRTIIDFDDWNFSPRLAEKAFVFVPPHGAVKASRVELPEVQQ